MNCSERADSTETLLSVRIPERPGAFRDLYSIIAPRNVTEFSYRYNTQDRADVIISFQARGTDDEKLQDAHSAIKELQRQGYGVSNLGNNELGKVRRVGRRLVL